MKRYIRPVGAQSRQHQEHRLAHLPPYLRHAAEANREVAKTVQELLRHTDGRITLDVYAQAENAHKRAAQSKVVGMMVPGVGTDEINVHVGHSA